jgi:hypothetical protein
MERFIALYDAGSGRSIGEYDGTTVCVGGIALKDTANAIINASIAAGKRLWSKAAS